MKRTALIVLRVSSVPVGVILVPKIYDLLIEHAPSVDRFVWPYAHLTIGVICETLAALIVAALVSSLAYRLYGRFARLASVAVVLPILLEVTPFNSTYHDYHWLFLDWALASYETLIIFLFVLRFTASLPSQRNVLTTGSSDRGAESSVGQGGSR